VVRGWLPHLGWLMGHPIGGWVARESLQNWPTPHLGVAAVVPLAL
jgi:hypothetical protein